MGKMELRIGVIILVSVFCFGCETSKPPGGEVDRTAPARQTRLATSNDGKVLSINRNGRFVVLNFPIGRVPPPGDRLFVYREGAKVAEIKVSGPQDNDNTVADIVTGEVQPGDEVRDE